jgi:hypothetical protein
MRMAPPSLARRISWRRHEITLRPPKFRGEAATKFRARRRVIDPYLPPYSLVARRYSTQFSNPDQLRRPLPSSELLMNDPILAVGFPGA